uniref:hemicentin-1-like isoform X1 n=1 Tax=Ciona intestinalis TaxID=7719 RepID=UPI000EF5207F|nr:hemicentin-1-like isoform X1 [Ciona intestinalis]|eukprot:XP_026691172.1 hemicentin-1-like isoform X1 [Ciona intestinalis]
MEIQSVPYSPILLYIVNGDSNNTSQHRFWPTGPCTDSTCVLSQWSVWSSCTLTCGFGLTTRTRSVSTRQSCTGSPCNDRRTEIQSCYPRCCPVNCRWENWLTWSSCSTSCGGGVQTRARNYARVASCGGTCVGESEETRACNTACCPVDCVWDSWASYGTCSASCGGGRQGRERVILVNAACGGRQCSGPETESRTCNDLNCPRNCLWEMWEAWGDCSVTCGGGVQYRRRRVNLQAIHGGSACMGSSVMSRYCNSECCPVNCRWGSWNSWSDCSKSCENGTRQRTRNFAVEGACGGTACIGMNTSVETCNQVCCPVHCAWSDWTNWESCSRPCGNGTQSRRRTESISSLCNGDVCAGKANDTRMCNTHCCPGMNNTG